MLDTWPANNWRYKMDIKPSSACIKKITFEDSDEETDIQHDNGKTLQDLQKEIQKKDRLRWNFDFVNNKPLPGNYQWGSMGPFPPRRIEHANESSGEHSDRSSESESDSSVLSSPTSSISSPPPTNRSFIGNAAAASPRTEAQRKLGEFFRQKKRISPSTKGDEPKTKRVRTSSTSSQTDRPLTPRSLFNPINPDKQD